MGKINNESDVVIKSIRSTDEISGIYDIYEIGVEIDGVKGSIVFGLSLRHSKCQIASVFMGASVLTPPEAQAKGILGNIPLYGRLAQVVNKFEHYEKIEGIEFNYHYLPEGADWEEHSKDIDKKIKQGIYSDAFMKGLLKQREMESVEEENYEAAARYRDMQDEIVLTQQGILAISNRIARDKEDASIASGETEIPDDE